MGSTLGDNWAGAVLAMSRHGGHQHNATLTALVLAAAEEAALQLSGMLTHKDTS